jgi:DNA-binding response OmpR family regulator
MIGESSNSHTSNHAATILVVDDEDDIRAVVRLTLTRAGFEVREAADGESALSSVEEELPDLILLDVLMPGIDGFEVCRQLRADERTAELPILIYSAKSDAQSRQDGLDAGATDYLMKPLRPEHLIAHVRRALENSGRPF